LKYRIDESPSVQWTAGQPGLRLSDTT